MSTYGRLGLVETRSNLKINMMVWYIRLSKGQVQIGSYTEWNLISEKCNNWCGLSSRWCRGNLFFDRYGFTYILRCTGMKWRRQILNSRTRMMATKGKKTRSLFAGKRILSGAQGRMKTIQIKRYETCHMYVMTLSNIHTVLETNCRMRPEILEFINQYY